VCSSHFEGESCDRCSVNYFGSSCEPFPIIQSTDRSLISDIGGGNLTLYGRNFDAKEFVGPRACVFFSNMEGANCSTTRAAVIDDSTLECSVPVRILCSRLHWYLRLGTGRMEHTYSTHTLQVRFTLCLLSKGERRDSEFHFYSSLVVLF
jgi:hypothetical protein